MLKTVKRRLEYNSPIKKKLLERIRPIEAEVKSKASTNANTRSKVVEPVSEFINFKEEESNNNMDVDQETATQGT